MPIYEYRCQECQQIFEEWQKGFEEQDVACPVCGGSSQRLISNTSFVLKGSGWYVTDYSRKSGQSNSTDGNGQKTSAAASDSAPSNTSETSTTPPSSAKSSET